VSSDGSLVRPAYGAASLIDVLPSALAVLTGSGPDPLRLTDRLAGVRRIAVLLVDGLGYHQVPASGIRVRGDLTKLTSAFPSTTPVSVVGFGTGVPPGAHGVLGFTTRIPGTDRKLNHVHWSDDPDPRIWQPVPTMFERAAAAGVAVTVVSRAEFAGSGLTVAAYRGATYRGVRGVDALARRMRRSLRAGTGPALVYGYHPDLDRAGHEYGVASPPWRDRAADVARLVNALADGLPADSALLVTADHGQLDVPAHARFDLDGDLGLRDGVALTAGEARVRYLHVVPGAAADVAATWRAVLGDAARVMTRDEVVGEGWYGAVRPEHLGRIGDLVVVCRGEYAVVASAAEPNEARLVAFHGSWTPVEMDVPLLVVRGGEVS
jgi:hypothetical protein